MPRASSTRLFRSIAYGCSASASRIFCAPMPPARMKEIIEFVKENNVKTIFFETLATPEVSETIAKETGANTDVLNPIEGLTQEELDANKDYLSIMQDNLKAIENALK